jgi:hypothetical protein
MPTCPGSGIYPPVRPFSGFRRCPEPSLLPSGGTVIANRAGRAVSSTQSAAAVRLALSEQQDGPAHPAPWIGPLVALGARAARYSAKHPDTQLIVVVTVPTRGFAAALLGCGWMLSTPAPKLFNPFDVMRTLESGTPVRVVTETNVMTGIFREVDESHSAPRLRLASGQWQADKVRAIAVLPDLDAAERQARPTPGGICEMARLTPDWDARLCSPPQDLAIIGTLSWIRDDLDAYLWRCGDSPMPPDRIASLLLPAEKRAATWSTRIIKAAGFADTLPLPSGLKAVALDGAGAIRYITEIETPLVFAVLDRSVADESAAELLVQLRNTRAEPIPVPHSLQWPGLPGVEVLAFTVAL